MTLFILNLLPFALSFFLGIFFITLLDNEKKISSSLKILLSAGLGLGLSSYITFLSFLLFNEFNRLFILTIHLILLIFFIKNSAISNIKIFGIKEMIKKLNIKHLILFFIFIVFLIPTIYTISLYPNGGWDAWAVWNFKARTLFLGQNDWTNIFHPTLWRSSPHYPLFLPLLNVWGWIFSTTPTQNIPILVSILFTTLTLGLLFYSLRNRTPLFFNILLLLALSSSSLFYKFASSQYADIVIGFYLLASFYCLIQAKMKDNKTFALLSGIFLSILSFTKNEGLMASVIIGSLAIPYLLKQRSLNKKKILLSFFVGVFISCIPFIIFQFFYAPQNLTFINGFESLTKPSDFSRLKAIFMFYFFQLKTFSWNGFWIILLVGLILGKKKMFNAQTIIIPLFLILYGGILTLYYFLNTYFDILWWLSQTFHRIVFSLLPIIFYWLGTSLFWNKSQKEK